MIPPASICHDVEQPDCQVHVAHLGQEVPLGEACLLQHHTFISTMARSQFLPQIFPKLKLQDTHYIQASILSDSNTRITDFTIDVYLNNEVQDLHPPIPYLGDYLPELRHFQKQDLLFVPPKIIK